MYEIIKTVIESKRYELADMLEKIDTMWLQDEITEEQKTELVDLARENAKLENSYSDLQKQIEQAFSEIAALKERVDKLDGTEPDPEEYPEYVQPTGSHDAYHKDDKVTYKGKKYICIAPEDVAVVWDPETYPAYWQIVE